MATASVSSSAKPGLFANPDLLLKFSTTEDDEQSLAFLAKSMQLIDAKIITLSKEIMSLHQSRDEAKSVINLISKENISLVLDDLLGLMKEVQQKAEAKSIDLKPFLKTFKKTADVFIEFYHGLTIRRELNFQNAEKAVLNFDGVKKGKHAQDIILCLMIQELTSTHGSRINDEDIGKATQFFYKIHGSNTAMKLKMTDGIKEPYLEALTSLLKAYKNGDFHEGRKQKMYELIMSKMSDEQIVPLLEEYPANPDNVSLLRGQSHSQSIDDYIDKGDFKKIIAAMMKITDCRQNQKNARAVLNKYITRYMFSEDEEERKSLKENLITIIDKGLVIDDEKAVYLAIFNDK